MVYRSVRICRESPFTSSMRHTFVKVLVWQGLLPNGECGLLRASP